jgi:hypothetical protein
MFAALTPYAAAQVTNRVLEARGLDRKVTPQMLYTYAKKGTIATIAGTSKVTFDGEAFKTWLDAYIKRIESGETASRVDYDELAKSFQ